MIKFIHSTPHFKDMKNSRIIIIYNVFTLPSYLKKLLFVVKQLLNYMFLFVLIAGQEDLTLSVNQLLIN